MRNWEQVLTVPPATSDWTVTQISLNKKNEKKSSNHNRKKQKTKNIRQITTGKNRNKTANISATSKY
jgi:hypothetical protein